jgi:hypothetical protein
MGYLFVKMRIRGSQNHFDLIAMPEINIGSIYIRPSGLDIIRPSFDLI